MPVSLIKIEPNQLEQVASRFRTAACDLEHQKQQLDNAYNCLDWQFLGKAYMNTRISAFDSTNQAIINQLNQMSSYLLTVANRMAEADRSGGMINRALFSELTTGLSSSARQSAKLNPSVLGVGSILAPAIIGGMGWLRRTIMGKGLLAPINSPSVGSDENVRIIINTISENRKSLSRLIADSHWGNDYMGKKYGSQECKGFVKQVYNDIFGISELPATNKRTPYLFDESSSITQLSEFSFSGEEINKQDILKCLENAQEGDIIQMKITLSDGSSTPHSAIYMGHDENGILLFDANWEKDKDKLLIKEHTINYDDFIEYLSHNGNGFSVYSPSEWTGNISTPTF
jgi:hypothetical protein